MTSAAGSIYIVLPSIASTLDEKERMSTLELSDLQILILGPDSRSLLLLPPYRADLIWSVDSQGKQCFVAVPRILSFPF